MVPPVCNTRIVFIFTLPIFLYLGSSVTIFAQKEPISKTSAFYNLVIHLKLDATLLVLVYQYRPFFPTIILFHFPAKIAVITVLFVQANTMSESDSSEAEKSVVQLSLKNADPKVKQSPYQSYL